MKQKKRRMSEDHSKNWPPEFLCIPLDQVEEWRKSGSIPGATSAASGATSAAACGTSAASGGTASSSCDNHGCGHRVLLHIEHQPAQMSSWRAKLKIRREIAFQLLMKS